MSSLAPLAILLLGGRSTRFWPLGEKPLLRFCGQTLFSHQLNLLATAGLTEVLIIGQKENLPTLKNLPTPPSLSLTFAEQTNLAGGMAAALLDTSSHWKDRSLIIISGNDIISPQGLTNLLQASQDTETDGILLAQKVSSYFPGGYLTVNSQNRIQNIIEKPTPGKEPSDLVNLVFHYHRSGPALFQALQNNTSTQDDHYEQALSSLFKEKNYLALPYSEYWHALKYPWHALKLNQHFLSSLQPYTDDTAQISPTATIHGNVYISHGVKIFDHATIVGPTYLGPNCIIGNNALVRESSLEENCTVGYNTEVARSLWQPSCRTHINYTGDTILSENVSLGAGAITANLRLDEQSITSSIKNEKIDTQINKFGTAIGANSRLGVHVTISPGVKIGANSLIASHLLLTTDIPDNQFVYLKNGQLTNKPNRLTTS